MDDKSTGTAMRQSGSMPGIRMKSQFRQEIKSRQRMFIAGDRMALSPIKWESRPILDSQIAK
jgi:hypothetical protein